MSAIAWAIVFATIEICGTIDDAPERDKGTSAFQLFMAIMSLVALAMVIACTVKEWR